jgi:hypothetical protein
VRLVAGPARLPAAATAESAAVLPAGKGPR